jgi:hypothetical protein
MHPQRDPCSISRGSAAHPGRNRDCLEQRLKWYPPTRRRAKEPKAVIALICREKDFEVAIHGCLVNIKLGPHERTPSWEGEDIFSVCDVLPFPEIADGRPQSRMWMGL